MRIPGHAFKPRTCQIGRGFARLFVAALTLFGRLLG